MDTHEIFFETKSPHDFDKTVELLTQSIAMAGWKMPALHDMKQTLKNFGKEVLPVKVIEICHPEHSSRILECSDERIISPMMPCRIAVYMKNDGNTYVSRINSLKFAESFGGTISDVMNNATADVEKIITKTLTQ